MSEGKPTGPLACLLMHPPTLNPGQPTVVLVAHHAHRHRNAQSATQSGAYATSAKHTTWKHIPKDLISGLAGLLRGEWHLPPKAVGLSLVPETHVKAEGKN